MRRLLLIGLLLAGCGTADAPGGNEIAREAVQTANLTGLYRAAGAGAGGGELCILDRGVGNARFGLVVTDARGRSCSGAGAAVRDGDALRLDMAGDEDCAIIATVAEGNVAFPPAMAAGCAYYCAAGASMAGARFDKVGGTAGDAMRARDLVGDPLCG